MYIYTYDNIYIYICMYDCMIIYVYMYNIYTDVFSSIYVYI